MSGPEKPKEIATPAEAPPADMSVEPDSVEVEYDVGGAEMDVEVDLEPDSVAEPIQPPSQFTLRRRHIFQPPFGMEFKMSPPTIDRDRDPDDVRLELAQRAYEFDPYHSMRKAVQTLRASRMNSIANLRRRQSVIFLNLVLYPFIEGLADELQVSPAEQVQVMVQRKQTIGTFINRNRDAVAAVMNDPRIRIWGGLARPALDATDADIRGEENVEWWMEIVKRTRNDFYTVLDKEKNGRWWLAESLVDTLNFLKGVLAE